MVQVTKSYIKKELISKKVGDRLLYTSMPLDRIYTNKVSSVLIPRYNSNMGETNEEASKKMEYRSFDIQHGKVYAKLEGENYIVDSVNSTDMSDYLNNKYLPGSILSEK